MSEEVTIVKPVPSCFGSSVKQPNNCSVCGSKATAWLAKDEHGDFLYPVFCTNNSCMRGYHANADNFLMTHVDDWNRANSQGAIVKQRTIVDRILHFVFPSRYPIETGGGE